MIQYWSLLLGMPITGVLLTLASFGLHRLADRFSRREGAFGLAVGVCFFFAGMFVLFAAAAAVVATLVLVVFGGLHAIGVVQLRFLPW